MVAAALLLCGEAQAQSSGGGLSSFFGNIFSGSAKQPHAAAAAQPRPAAPARPHALERRGRRLRPSPDDRERDPRGGGEFRQLRRRDVARRRAPQHLAGKLPALHRGACARSAHHGPDGFAAGIHQVDLGLSRHPGERQPPRQGPRDPRQIQAAVRRRPKKPMASTAMRSRRSGASNSNYSTQMGDRSVLQSTATLACIGRRQKYFRDEFLSALEILQPRRSAPRTDARLLGRRVRADAVHADRVQALRGRCRRRRPPRRGRRSRRPDRLHRQQPQEGRLADRPDLGLRGRGARRASITCWRTAPRR